MAARPEQTVAPEPPLVETRGLHVSFAGHDVLRDVSLSVPRGQTLAIIGESGCGKTVLLKTLLALVRPSRGEVFFEQKNLMSLGEKQLTAQRIRFGFVFQNAALFDSMTVAQNVAFPLRQHSKLSSREIHEIIVARLAEVGLPEQIMQRKPAELSGGMRKRVGLARALAMNPEILLYDEPTTGLDPIMSDVIAELILHTRKRYPVTSIVVTHDMQAAMKVADRVVMLYPLSRLDNDEPQILFDGKAHDIQRCGDPRVTQFVRGEAGQRLMEMRETGSFAEVGL
jgi:phospholipid/cholesterol/gamma-HCH transport system ATP-binding protein